MKYTEFDVEDYLGQIEAGFTDRMESHIIAMINDEDIEWEEVEDISDDGLYVTNADEYLYKLVCYGKVVFEIY